MIFVPDFYQTTQKLTKFAIFSVVVTFAEIKLYGVRCGVDAKECVCHDMTRA